MGGLHRIGITSNTPNRGTTNRREASDAVSVAPYYQDSHVTIYNADCRDVLPTLEPVDLVLTDPPYGLGALPPRGGGRVGTFDYGTRAVIRWDTFTMGWLDDLPSDIPVGVFCSIRRLPEVMTTLGTTSALFYVKSNPSPLGSSIEACVTRGMATRSPQHFESYNAANGQEHPTQKPLDLMRWIIGREQAAAILDPFMGSGTTLRAAKDLGRKAIGIEIEERYCEIAAKRMSQLAMELG